MDNLFTVDFGTKNVTTARRPIVAGRSDDDAFDRMGLLDANYHGSADLLLRLSSRDWFNMDVFALDRFLELPMMPFCLHLFCDLWQLHLGDQNGEPAITDVLHLGRLARMVSEKYSFTNYYHSILHGMDVAHSFSCLLWSAKARRIVRLDKHECLVALLAALMHDIDHPGVTYDYFYDTNIENFFKAKNMARNSGLFINADSHTSFKKRQLLSVRFKRYLHSLETHQAGMAVSVLLVSGLIAGQSESRQRQLCQLMTDLVESTDMSLHRSFNTEMRRLVALLEGDEEHEDRLPGQLSTADQLLVLCCLLKCSDTSNPAKHWDYYYAWSRLITAEFFAQGDKEHYIRGCLNANKFVTHFCDRHRVNFELSQIGFIKCIRESFQQVDDILRCRLTRRIVLQLDLNLRRMLMIREVKRTRLAMEADSSTKLRVTLMLRQPTDAAAVPAGAAAKKLKCCLLLCDRDESRSAVTVMRASKVRMQQIF